MLEIERAERSLTRSAKSRFRLSDWSSSRESCNGIMIAVDELPVSGHEKLRVFEQPPGHKDGKYEVMG
jgi:hypothetical protein